MPMLATPAKSRIGSYGGVAPGSAAALWVGGGQVCAAAPRGPPAPPAPARSRPPPRGAALCSPAAPAAAPTAAMAGLGPAARIPGRSLPRRLREVVAGARGEVADIPPRVPAPRAAQVRGQPVVVENRPAGGIVAGGEAVATAPPDGYTLLSATPQVAIVQSMVKDLAFDPRRDLAPIALVGVIPNVLVAGPRTPA